MKSLRKLFIMLLVMMIVAPSAHATDEQTTHQLYVQLPVLDEEESWNIEDISKIMVVLINEDESGTLLATLEDEEAQAATEIHDNYALVTVSLPFESITEPLSAGCMMLKNGNEYWVYQDLGSYSPNMKMVFSGDVAHYGLSLLMTRFDSQLPRALLGILEPRDSAEVLPLAINNTFYFCTEGGVIDLSFTVLDKVSGEENTGRYHLDGLPEFGELAPDLTVTFVEVNDYVADLAGVTAAD